MPKHIYIFECGCRHEKDSKGYAKGGKQGVQRLLCKKHLKPFNEIEFTCDCGKIEVFSPGHKGKVFCAECAQKKRTYSYRKRYYHLKKNGQQTAASEIQPHRKTDCILYNACLTDAVARNGARATIDCNGCNIYKAKPLDINDYSFVFGGSNFPSDIVEAEISREIRMAR